MAILSTLMGAALVGAGSAFARGPWHNLAAPLESRASTSYPVIAQMFEWNYASVQTECPTLANAGYTYVQVSPPAEHITGPQWWASYQRVSSQLVSRHGNRAQFASMISACNNAGVQVIVDVVINHMTAGSGTGTGGTPYTQYSYNGIYSGFDFHYNDQCGTSDDGIDDWSNKTQIQFCQLTGIADLKTESDYVRQSLVDHLNDILSLGAAGFRFDAAKHVPITDLQNIYGRLSRQPYIVSEVVGNGSPLPPSGYTSLGTVTITQSYTSMLNAFTTNAGLVSLNGWENGQGVDSSAAAVFVATHDSERNDGVGQSLMANSPNNGYTLATVFALAYPYGTPTVLSSYQFNSPDDGPPNGGSGTCYGAGGVNGFWCQHRWTPIANMVNFRKVVGGAPLVNWQTGNNMQIAFGRGSAGFVAINNANSAWSVTLTTQLPAGSYCEAANGGVSGSGCSGTTATVSGGQITLSVPAYTAYAFYTGAQPSGSVPPPPSTGRAIHPSAFSGKCLDIKDGVLADGTLLQLWDCANDVQQEFVFTSNGAGTSIQVVGTNFCLDAGSNPSNGSQLKIWTCYAGIAAQTWSFTEGGHVSNQGQCIDMTNGVSTNGNIMQTWACSDGNANQMWSA